MAKQTKKQAKDPVQQWAEAKAHLDHMAADAHRFIAKEFGATLDALRDACIEAMRRRAIKVVEVPIDPVRKFIQDLTGKGETLIVQLSETAKPDNSKSGLTKIMGKAEAEKLWSSLATKPSTSLSLKRVVSGEVGADVDES